MKGREQEFTFMGEFPFTYVHCIFHQLLSRPLEETGKLDFPTSEKQNTFDTSYIYITAHAQFTPFSLLYAHVLVEKNYRYSIYEIRV